MGAAVAATGLLLTSTASWVGSKVCNKSSEKVSVSIGYKSGDYGWTSEGWWSVEPGDCTRTVNGDLDQRYYYVCAAGDNGGLWAAHKGEQDGGVFCVAKQKFTFHNRDFSKGDTIDCEAGDQLSKQFSEVDTEAAADFTYDLKD